MVVKLPDDILGGLKNPL